MAVRLRLKRLGNRNRPFYRLAAVDQRQKRDGSVIEELGWYNPLAPAEKQVELDADRCAYWLSVGAQPSQTVASLLRKSGVNPKSGTKQTAEAS
ncbi:MAG: 30S ribosomal protein S16 [Phycisphaeraceae bacterium]